MGAWTAEEDEIIIEGRKNGLSYCKIADQLPTRRRAKMIRVHWKNDLEPIWTVGNEIVSPKEIENFY